MQKALIVRDDRTGTDELDRLLSDGWQVVSSCPMPSSRAAWGAGGDWSNHADYYTPATCLVILSKSDNP